MWLQTSSRHHVQLAHVVDLYAERDGADVLWVMAELASGIIKPLEANWASEEEAWQAIRAVLYLAAVNERFRRTQQMVTFRQALTQLNQADEATKGGDWKPGWAQPAAPAEDPGWPEGNPSHPPPQHEDLDVQQIGPAVRDAAERARAINTAAAAGATRGDGDAAAGGRILR